MTQFLLFLPVEVEKIAAFEFTKPVDNNYGQSLKKSTHLITTQTTISTMIKMTSRTATTLRMMVRRRSIVNKSKNECNTASNNIKSLKFLPLQAALSGESYPNQPLGVVT